MSHQEGEHALNGVRSDEDGDDSQEKLRGIREEDRVGHESS